MTPQERLRKHQRMLDKSIRELDRERAKLEREEKVLVEDIKKAARDPEKRGALRTMAGDLVRKRRCVLITLSLYPLLAAW